MTGKTVNWTVSDTTNVELGSVSSVTTAGGLATVTIKNVATAAVSLTVSGTVDGVKSDDVAIEVTFVEALPFSASEGVKKTKARKAKAE